VEGQATAVDSKVQEFQSQQLNSRVPSLELLYKDLEDSSRSISFLHVRTLVYEINALQIELQI